jgi:hypothetical protein
MRSSLCSLTHCWKRRWQVWYGGYFLGAHATAPLYPRPTGTR